MLLHEYIYLTYNFYSLWNYLCEKKVIRDKVICLKCKKEILLNNVLENHIFHCTQKYYKVIKGRKRKKAMCNFKISAFHGTWFEREHMDLVKICRLIGYFLTMLPPRQKFLVNELKISNTSVVNWIHFCREVNNT